MKAAARHLGQISVDLKVIPSIYVLGKYQKENSRASWVRVFSPILILAWEQNPIRAGFEAHFPLGP